MHVWDKYKHLVGAWWLSGRVLDSRLRCGLEPQWKHCIVSLNKTLYPLLSPGIPVQT